MITRENHSMKALNTSAIDPSWQSIFNVAFASLDAQYVQSLQQDSEWLPGPEKIFNAFSLPLSKARYILFGESPYPRLASANGYAFWDAAVKELWSEQGLSKSVNRATSLRNIIKMLLVARGSIKATDTSQAAITTVDKTTLIKTGTEFFQAFLHHGFLLLNTTLVLKKTPVRAEANAWLPFIEKILQLLTSQHYDITLILFGKIAHLVDALPSAKFFKRIAAEHPYNISFIQNPEILKFFKPFDFLKK